MPNKAVLHQYLHASARMYPNLTALKDLDESVTYSELDKVSNDLRDWLIFQGVRPGDRVGIYLNKSINAVISIFGILKAGAAYIPVDPSGLVARNAYILNDCSVKVIIIDHQFRTPLRTELEKLGKKTSPKALIVDGQSSLSLALAIERETAAHNIVPAKAVITQPDDLAVILYTSGSTGRPKGVMLSHENAASFVDWCSDTFKPRSYDRFASHAPFHFDLSILDIFVCIKHGACLCLIREDTGKQPALLAELISTYRITIWYSTPSILSLLAQFGRLNRFDCTHLRYILFAGEVFPIKFLRSLMQLLPHPEYFNLYGPTETNVCTFYKLPPAIPSNRSEPFPIGKCCSHLQAKVVDRDGRRVKGGDIGELCVAGPQVMKGYWKLEKETEEAFLKDQTTERWYRTGDRVFEDKDGNLCYVGRMDRMVKRKGYRIELGEIEAALYRHPMVREAAATAIHDDDGLRIKVFLNCVEGRRPSLIELKGFCVEVMPMYMIPDQFSLVDTIPKTSTSKIDYQALETCHQSQAGKK